MYPWLGFLTPPLIIVIINFEPNFLAPRWRIQNSFPLSLCKMLIFISSIFMHQRVCTMSNGHFSPALCLFVCLIKELGSEQAKSHWLHLFDFSPLCDFKCFLKWPGWEEAKSHWLHLFGFSPLCVFKCLLKVIACEDAKSHWLHLFDFSPLCFFKCLFKEPA